MINSYKEGDVWTERGKTWTIKNGVKRTVTKMSETRKKLHTPLACPKCNRSMSHWLDKKMFTFNGCCHDCTIKFEHELRKQGRYEEYEKHRILANAKGFIQDLESYMVDYIRESNNNSLITEEGDVESWIGNTSKRLEELSTSHIQQAKEDLKKVENGQ